MTSTRQLKAGVVLAALGILACGSSFFRLPKDRSNDIPRLLVVGRGDEGGQHIVAFRVIPPESRRSDGCVISKPQVVETSGRVRDVGLIRYTTPTREPALGFVDVDGGDYRLRLGVALEETGVNGWLHRLRNCWERKTLTPLREKTYGDYVLVTSDRISNAVPRGSVGEVPVINRQ